MAFSFELVTGSDLTLDRDNLVIIRRFRATDTLPYAGIDYFDALSTSVMAFINQHWPTYSTPAGTLFWNSIQIHENYYAQNYDIAVTYSPFNKQTGAYQITVDQAVGNTKITAGERIAGYPEHKAVDNGGVIFDGESVQEVDIPVAEDRITVMYRHPQMYLIPAYIRAVGKLRGYPNSDVFLGYAPGEVMYLGGSFTETNTEASASYSFAISPNATDLVVGEITIAEKKGWDLISPVYEPSTDDNDDGETHAVRRLKYIEIIRPRPWKAYTAAFGWGG